MASKTMTHRLKLLIALIALSLAPLAIADLLEGSALGSANLAETSKRSARTCPKAVGKQVSNAGAIRRRAGQFWNDGLSIPASDFRVSLIRCGDLTGRGDPEIVVVLGVRGGTGGSPKPWGIYNRARRGRLHLVHFDPGRELICPSTPTIHRQVLTIYKVSEYIGAHTLCDRIVRFKWRRGRYVQTVERPAFHRCRKPPEIPAEGGGFNMTRFRVSKMACAKAVALVSRNTELRGWNCLFLEKDHEIRCVAKGDPRRWFAYVPS